MQQQEEGTLMWVSVTQNSNCIHTFPFYHTNSNWQTNRACFIVPAEKRTWTWCKILQGKLLTHLQEKIWSGSGQKEVNECLWAACHVADMNSGPSCLMTPVVALEVNLVNFLGVGGRMHTMVELLASGQAASE